jgi:hypothetical protein
MDTSAHLGLSCFRFSFPNARRCHLGIHYAVLHAIHSYLTSGIRALSSANLLGNYIGIEQAKALAAILKEHPTLKSLCGNKGDETELNMSDTNMRSEGAIMLVPEIIDNGAITSLDISNNSIGLIDIFPDGWSSEDNEWGTQYFVHTDGRKQKAVPEGAKSSGVVAIANVIPDMRALSSANLLMNNIGTEQAQVLANILKEHPTLKSLCGNKGDETELDMSGKKMRTDGAIMLAPEFIDNGAMTVLNLASNFINAEGAKHIACALKVSKCVLAVVFGTTFMPI